MERLHDADFQGRQLRRDGVWVVAFLADWCPFCRRFRETFGSRSFPNSVRVAEADVTEESSRLWDDFSIEVVPMLGVFRGGQLVFRVDSDLGVGLPPDALARAEAAAGTTPR